jgi:DNA-binding transcriptional LysR family regulator
MNIEIAAWVAPAATMIAALMTAANLGARLTGWGFVVFTLGSICWSWVGYSSGQSNLLASNSFLTLINLVESGGGWAASALMRMAVDRLPRQAGPRLIPRCLRRRTSMAWQCGIGMGKTLVRRWKPLFPAKTAC